MISRIEICLSEPPDQWQINYIQDSGKVYARKYVGHKTVIGALTNSLPQIEKENRETKNPHK